MPQRPAAVRSTLPIWRWLRVEPASWPSSRTFFIASCSRLIRFFLRGFRYLSSMYLAAADGQSPSLCGCQRQYGGGCAGDARVGDDGRCALPGFQHQGLVVGEKDQSCEKDPLGRRTLKRLPARSLGCSRWTGGLPRVSLPVPAYHTPGSAGAPGPPGRQLSGAPASWPLGL